MCTRLVFILISVMLCTACGAQITAVVYDIETHMPVEGATVFINPKGTATTDRYGRFFFSGQCNSLTLTHVAYEKRRMYRSEVGDTIFMLPKMNVIDGVVIVGNKPKISSEIMSGTRNAAMTAPRQGGMASFDFFRLFQKKPKSHKEREKFNKLMRDYSK